jgi:hypothetical protein
MKIQIITIITVLFFTSSSFSQATSDSIQYDKKFGQFYKNDTKLKPGEMLDVMINNKEAYDIMWTAKKYNLAGKVCLIAGAAGIGYMVIDFLRTGDINYYALGIGAGVAFVSIPLSSEYKNRAKKAALIYNAGLSKTSSSKLLLHFGLSENGFGAKLKF